MEAGAAREPIRGETAAERATIAAPVTADPGPLGLAAFALTTFVLSMINADLVGGSSTPVVLSLALAYGGIAHVLAGMWEFRTGNTFGATAFTSFGAFWISFWAFEQFFAKDVPKTHLGSTVGLYLIAWGIFTTYMWVASLRTTAAISLVFILLAPTFFILGIGQANGTTNLVKIGGYLGIATAAAAWYASFAAVVNSTFGRTVMPVIPLKRQPATAGPGASRRHVAVRDREPVAH
jgi:succinate-acetate transporter protein